MERAPLTKEEWLALEKKANDLRHLCLQTTVWAGSGHIGGGMSVMDMIAALAVPGTNICFFDRDMPIRFLPIKFDKLRMKLEAAKRAGYDKAITFEFSHFMSPQSAYLQAGHLYDRYKEYFEIK